MNANGLAMREDAVDDWYNDSDTSDEILDPNIQEGSLFQKANMLPVELCEEHFEEGLIPKGEFLRTHRVGPLGLSGFLHLGLLFGFFHPYESWY